MGEDELLTLLKIDLQRTGADLGDEDYVRIWRDRDVLTSDMCGIGENQYRILQVQHTLDEDGLQVTDLSLERVGTHFDLAGI